MEVAARLEGVPFQNKSNWSTTSDLAAGQIT
jgi:hypothetical protein